MGIVGKLREKNGTNGEDVAEGALIEIFGVPTALGRQGADAARLHVSAQGSETQPAFDGVPMSGLIVEFIKSAEVFHERGY